MESKFNSNDNLFENFFLSFGIFFLSAKNKIKPPSPAPKIFAPSAPFFKPKFIRLFIVELETDSVSFFL